MRATFEAFLMLMVILAGGRAVHRGAAGRGPSRMCAGAAAPERAGRRFGRVDCRGGERRWGKGRSGRRELRDVLTHGVLALLRRGQSGGASVAQPVLAL